MEAVATTGLYPEPNRVERDPDTDPKLSLMQLAVRASSPHGDEQQLIHRGSRIPVAMKRDELGL